MFEYTDYPLSLWLLVVDCEIPTVSHKIVSPILDFFHDRVQRQRNPTTLTFVDSFGGVRVGGV